MFKLDHFFSSLLVCAGLFLLTTTPIASQEGKEDDPVVPAVIDYSMIPQAETYTGPQPLAPINDLISNAYPLSLSVLEWQAIDGATTSPSDPRTCPDNTSVPHGSVWFTFTPTQTGAYLITTQRSDYDTVLSVHRYFSGTFMQLRCDDDSGPGRTSRIGMNMAADIRYFIMVHKYGAPPASDVLYIRVVPEQLGDALTIYRPAAPSSISYFDTFNDFPPIVNNGYLVTPPAASQYVMGDWNADGQRTMGFWGNGAFWLTNQVDPPFNFTGVWIGAFPSVYAVAGRFSTETNDCVGVVQVNYQPPNVGFPLHYKCNLNSNAPLQGQWLGVVLQGSSPYQFVAGNWDNDSNRLDSIAARRGPLISWGNVAPASGVGTFPLAQYIGAPIGTQSSIVVAGDWNNDNYDTFGLYYPHNGYFYRRNDLQWDSGEYLLQRTNITSGMPASWRPYIRQFSTMPPVEAPILPPAADANVPLPAPPLELPVVTPPSEVPPALPAPEGEIKAE